MEAIVEFGKIILPAGAVLYAMFLTTRMFLRKEYDLKLIEMKTKNTEITLPIRLQAYERICLFLERIAPKNLVLRVNTPEMNALAFQQIMVKEVREEFGHNLSQQVYVSESAWEAVRNAMEEVILIINDSTTGMTEETPSVELAKVIFEKIIEREHLAVDSALSFVKKEIQQIL
ncbi:DUF7935 family protein [Reichenbachiella versicolor]|uniref:DUF7935 family protein n=1 Tax=Reichenbachiella versicolor TaxID=1821036 RepID=UPI000D6E8ACE|nr:hypothetical protein [Reichenbachiella versicolor]